MEGRDPDEAHRAATPLELLFDLTFVVAYGIAADELAHYLAEDHIRDRDDRVLHRAFAITWAWINFSWFASAYDTDDWVYRLTTMLQMVGVIILALGLPTVFESIDEGETVNNGVMVAGYVVMRVGDGLPLGARRAPGPGATLGVQDVHRHDPDRPGRLAGAAVRAHERGADVHLGRRAGVVEFVGPYIAERRKGGTPWHPHHIAERYGLLVIIALGEGIIGTIASLGRWSGRRDRAGTSTPGWSRWPASG